MQPTQQITKKKKWLLLVILGVAALLVIGIGVGGFIYIKSVVLPKKEVQRNMDLGDKYLTDMDYDDAILAYTEAININPKNEQAYLGLGRAYTALTEDCIENGEIEEAVVYLHEVVKILKDGYSYTDSVNIKDMLDELKEKELVLEQLLERDDFYFSEKLKEISDELIINCIMEDFDNDSVKEAFLYTLSQDEYDEYIRTNNFENSIPELCQVTCWYIDDSASIVFKDEYPSQWLGIELDALMIIPGTEIKAIIWRGDCGAQNTLDSIWIVEDGKPKLLLEDYFLELHENRIVSRHYNWSWSDQEDVPYYYIHEYEYRDGKMILIEEYDWNPEE